MPGRGPAPSSAHTRARNDHETTQLVKDGKVRGWELPPLTRKGQSVEWHPQTQSWWRHWRESPQAIRMTTDPDWDFLLDTALMHHAMWTDGKWELAAEVRLRVQKFGATPEDRSRLRVEVGVPLPSDEQPAQPTSPANVTSIDDRRSRLTS